MKPIAIRNFSYLTLHMGKLLILLKYVVFIFSSDINEGRRHVHVTDKKRNVERVCKFWIEPNIELHENIRFTRKEIKEIEKLLKNNINIINEQLDLFYKGKKLKSLSKNE